MTRAPALFVSHGSPMFALQPGELGPQLSELGGQLDTLRAVAVVSPHWQTRRVHVGTSPLPATIHDFGGFPEALYGLQYPAEGAGACAREAGGLLQRAGFAVAEDTARGLDHGAWVPLRHLFPQGTVPVFQVSMPIDLDAATALRMGQALSPLREQGVMVMGSGSLTHNLREYLQHVEDPQYVREFADWAAQAVIGRDTGALIDYRQRAPHARRAHPTEEHFLPLLVAAGAARGDEVARRLPGGITDGVLSMDSFAWLAR